MAALRPGGRLAYWSAHPDARFERALRGRGLQVEVHQVRTHPTAGTSHTIFVARRR
jgi:spermidine synthase